MKKNIRKYRPNPQIDIFDIIGEDDRPPPHNIKVKTYIEVYKRIDGTIIEIEHINKK